MRPMLAVPGKMSPCPHHSLLARSRPHVARARSGHMCLHTGQNHLYRTSPQKCIITAEGDNPHQETVSSLHLTVMFTTLFVECVYFYYIAYI